MIINVFIILCALAKSTHIPLGSTNCNAYYNAGSFSLAAGAQKAIIPSASYFEIEFDIDIHTLCVNPSGNWGKDALCNILRIGDPENDYSRFPILYGATYPDNSGPSSYWATRLTTDDECYSTSCGNKMDAIENIGMTTENHHIYIAADPDIFYMEIDGVMNQISVPNRQLPRTALPLWFSSNGGYRALDATVSGVCVRTSGSSLFQLQACIYVYSKIVHDFPSCKPNCLVNNGGCPNGINCHQIQNDIYRVDGECYQAISGCYGCLEMGAANSPQHLRPLGSCTSDTSCDASQSQVVFIAPPIPPHSLYPNNNIGDKDIEDYKYYFGIKFTKSDQILLQLITTILVIAMVSGLIGAFICCKARIVSNKTYANPDKIDFYDSEQVLQNNT